MITGNELVEELVEEYPEIVTLLRDEEIVCIVCGEPAWGTLKELVESKNKNIEEILEKINKELM